MEPKDEILWRLARKRAGFKKQLISCLVISSFLWTVWFVSGRDFDRQDYMPWPAWVMFAWGIAIALSYTNAYHGNTPDAIEKEYEKLKSQQS